MSGAGYVVWGPELSPYLLKLESMLAFHGLPFRRLPRDGGRLENLRLSMRIDAAVRRRSALRPPANDPLDEYPLVPYLLTADGRVLYDSSALGHWLDGLAPAHPALVPRQAPARFVALLLDEFFDEFGLYMVHHNRWKLAAADNGDPGARLANEYAKLLPPGLGPFFARWFARRQVRRLPYLFSVAPGGYRVPGLAEPLTPPSREGFPPTHELLEESWQRTLAALEGILARRPFLLGGAFTIADASAYGQLSMNLTDELAARRLRELAPRSSDWLLAIRDRSHSGASGETAIDASLAPLLEVVFETFVPLMRANAAAFERLRAAGETLFNERAFDAGRSLYDGTLLGHPYRSVAKSFQARVWRELVATWRDLAAGDRRTVEAAAGGRDLEALLA